MAPPIKCVFVIVTPLDMLKITFLNPGPVCPGRQTQGTKKMCLLCFAQKPEIQLNYLCKKLDVDEVKPVTFSLDIEVRQFFFI